MLSAPTSLATASATSYVPGAAYVWLGFWAVEVVPSPKLQSQLVSGAPPFAVRSWNVTARGASPSFGAAEKSAAGGVGAGVTVTKFTWFLLFSPSLDVTVSFTSYRDAA